MKGFGISSKTMSMLLLFFIILISLSLSGYTYLVSRQPATAPILSTPLIQ